MCENGIIVALFEALARVVVKTIIEYTLKEKS